MIKLTLKSKRSNGASTKQARDYIKKREGNKSNQIKFYPFEPFIISTNYSRHTMQQSMPDQQQFKQQKLYINFDDQEEQDSSTFQMVKKMIQHVKQQQLSPELLIFQQQLFEKLKEQLKQQQINVAMYKQKDDDDDTPNAEKNYKSVIYSMEIEKINYILKHYLRIRLEKIQKCSFYYFKNMTLADKLMSKPQLEFLKKYVDLRYKYYEKNVFKHLAKNFKGVGGMEIFLGKPQERQLLKTTQSNSDIVEPDVHSYVFVKMNRNPDQFRYQTDIPVNGIPKGESPIASSNDILFIPYAAAKVLMERSGEGDLVLI